MQQLISKLKMNCMILVFFGMPVEIGDAFDYWIEYYDSLGCSNQFWNFPILKTSCIILVFLDMLIEIGDAFMHTGCIFEKLGDFYSHHLACKCTPP